MTTYPCRLYPKGGRLPRLLVVRRVDLVHAAWKRSGVTQKAAEQALAAFLDIITESMKNGDTVKLNGAFRMEAKRKAARPGYNFHTGYVIGIPPEWTVKTRFSPEILK